jgi:twitching motility protein PilT
MTSGDLDGQDERALQIVIRILKGAVSAKASDIHLKGDAVPRVRVEGRLYQLDHPALSSKLLESCIRGLAELAGIPASQLAQKECDFSCEIPDGGRFRVHVYLQRGSQAVALRHIATPAPDFAALRLPAVIKRIAVIDRGLILITGATGNGKSTTIASMLEYINQNLERHIVTLEDPIEYLFNDQKSFFSQRDLGRDFESIQAGFESALREDPDMIFVGEIRTLPEFEIALNAAESGRVVISTFHSSNVTTAVSRMINFHAPEFQDAARNRIADALAAIVSQRLIPRKGSTANILVTEVFTRSPTAIECVRDPTRLRALTAALEAGTHMYGSHSFDQMLKLMVRDEIITLDTARAAAHNANDFMRNLQFG